MTISHFGNQYYRGLSSDTKPAAGTTAVLAEFYETDTGKVFRNNGTVWRPEYIKNPASMIVFKEGTTYYAQEADGTIVSSSTTDAAIPINYAINNIPGALARGYGARVLIFAGDYTCLTGIAADFNTTGYHGVSIAGEGIGTRIIFEPTGALTNGIHFRMLYPQLKDILVWAKNANTVNLVKLAGPSGAGQFNWGVLQNCSINGRYSGIPQMAANTIFPTDQFPVTGQTGVLIEGTHTASGWFSANHKIHNCEFFALDTGIFVRGQYADMCHHSNVHCGSCNTGVILEGVQHNLVNFRIEGGGPGNAEAIGHVGIWIRDPPDGAGGNIHLMQNINIELHKLDSTGILWDIDIDNNQIGNYYHSSQDAMTRIALVDNRKDVGASREFGQSISHIQNSKLRHGAANFGFCAPGKEQGILAGALKYQLDGVDQTFPVTNFVNGPYMGVTTGTAVSSVACVYYNNPTGNNIYTGNYPAMYCRFRPASNTNSRYFIGFINDFASPPSSNTEVLANKHGIGLYFDAQVSPNWRIMHNDGAASSTIADFPTFIRGNLTYAPTAVSSTQIYNCFVSYNDSNPSANVRVNGFCYDFKISAIPAAGQVLGPLLYVQNRNAGATRTLRLWDMEVKVLTI